MRFPAIPSDYEMHTRIIMGSGSLLRLEEEIEKMRVRKPMILAGSNVRRTGFYAKCLESVGRSAPDVMVFGGVMPEAPAEAVMNACDMITREGCDLLIAIGGGSCIDLAKAAAVVAANGGRPQDYAGYEVFRKPPVPLVAIPTTAGTGSEATSVAIISDPEKGVKFTIGHRELNYPKIAVLDPQSLESCTPEIVAEAGIDAFTHAFESFISLKANPVTEALSLRALHLVARNLKALHVDRRDSDAAANMLVASTMGGIAFASAGTGNVHCIGRHVGPRLHLSHGLCCAVLLCAVARFNLPACPDRFALIAEAMGIDVRGLSEAEAGRKAIAAMEELRASVGMAKSLGDYGCSEEMIESIAEESWSAYQKHYKYINPRTTTKEDYVEIIRDACS